MKNANTNTSEFNAMGKVDLRAACKKAGIKNYGKMKNQDMRDALFAALPATPNTWTSLGHNDKEAAPVSATKVVGGKRVEQKSASTRPSQPRIEKDPAPFVPRVSRKGYKIQKDRIEQNGVKRPSEGTVCGNVWAAFDNNPQIKAGELAALADANSWNRTNVSCEFYAWRKFNGIKGRSSK